MRACRKKNLLNDLVHASTREHAPCTRDRTDPLAYENCPHHIESVSLDKHPTICICLRQSWRLRWGSESGNSHQDYSGTSTLGASRSRVLTRALVHSARPKMLADNKIDSLDTHLEQFKLNNHTAQNDLQVCALANDGFLAFEP